jgi:hypothetical protein
MMEIGSVRLLTRYLVFDDGSQYVVEGEVRREPSRRRAEEVSREAVETIAELIEEGPTTAEDLALAVEELELQERGFRYRYGWQLQFEVQRALLVLVARGEATVQKDGRRFVYALAD